MDRPLDKPTILDTEDDVWNHIRVVCGGCGSILDSEIVEYKDGIDLRVHCEECESSSYSLGWHRAKGTEGY